MENKSWQASQFHFVWLCISFSLIHVARCKHHVALGSFVALPQAHARSGYSRLSKD